VTSAKDWYRWFKHTGGRQIRDLLMAEWDPIGVVHEPEARDEYDVYVGLIADRLRKGGSVDEVAVVLDDAERRMGMEPRVEETRRVAGLLHDWYGSAAPDAAAR
jgi:hypothetical protein